MAYIALYRKYRSQSFGELMGQEQVTRTLQGAIRTGRIAHAYLFHGARGCGKTSTARLLSRALNCVATDGPNPEPCGVCRMCVSIRDGACLDVIEMDAASETGIDDVREKIVENVQYAAAEARYKVYIIDEVHDLSAKAFDALLKTLEEPPAHVVFVLATTELHKVPITIRSRCQPYHFKRGTLQDLATAIRRVVDAEGYTADPEAVQSIARSAEGSWRDALSLLEQVLAYSKGRPGARAESGAAGSEPVTDESHAGHVDVETAQQAIGTVGSETLERVTEILSRGRWDETLGIAAQLIESGKDVRQLLTGLSGHLRDLLLIAAGAREAAELEIGAERLERLSPQAQMFSPSALLAMMAELAKADRDARLTNQHRWLMESTLLRLLTIQSGATASSMPAAQPLAATPAPVPRPPRTATMRAPAGTHARLAADRDEAMETGERELPGALVESVAPTAPRPAPAVERALEPAGAPAGGEPEQPLAAPASPFAEGITHGVIVRAWPRIVTAIGKKSKASAVFLEGTTVSALNGKTVVLRFTSSIYRDRIATKAKELVEQALNRALQTSGYKIRCEMAEPASAAPKQPAAPPEPLIDAPESARKKPRGDFGLQDEAEAPFEASNGDANGSALPATQEFERAEESREDEPIGESAEQAPEAEVTAPADEAPPPDDGSEPAASLPADQSVAAAPAAVVPAPAAAAAAPAAVAAAPAAAAPAPAAVVPAPAAAASARGARSAERRHTRTAAEQPSMLSEALALFGGEVLPVESEE